MPIVSSISGTYCYRSKISDISGIITNGLIIQLDAANPASYSGTGTTWTDLASSAAGLNNGTLSPTSTPPTYTAASPSYFTFNGSSQYVEISDTAEIRPLVSSRPITAIIWANITAYTAGEGLISKQFGSPSYDGFSLVFNTTNRLQLNMNGSTVNGNYVSASNNVFSLNTWTMFTAVVRFGGGASNPSKAYVNTTEVISAANSESGIPSNTAPLRLVSGIQEGTPFPGCQVGSFYYYNRALSAAEITTMFNETRGRFGV